MSYIPIISNSFFNSSNLKRGRFEKNMLRLTKIKLGNKC